MSLYEGYMSQSQQVFNVNLEGETVQLKAARDTVVLEGKNWPEEKITIKYKSELKAADPFEKERHECFLLFARPLF